MSCRCGVDMVFIGCPFGAGPNGANVLKKRLKPDSLNHLEGRPVTAIAGFHASELSMVCLASHASKSSRR